MSTRPRDQRSAFTIMEMIVVIGIISLIMSLLLPALGLARTNARTVQGLAHLNQIGKAVNVYAVDSKNLLPPGYDSTPVVETDWTTVIDGYLTDGADTYITNEETLDVFQCPNATYPAGRTHYSAHPVLMPDVSPGASPEFPRYKVARFRRPSDVVMVMDGAQRPPDDPTIPYTTYSTAWQLDAPDHVTTDPFFSRAAADNENPINPGPNHDNGGDANGTIRWRQEADRAANFLFADTHASTILIGNLRRRNIRVD